MNLSLEDQVIVALDTSETKALVKMVESLSPYISTFKVGLEVITAIGLKQTLGLFGANGRKVILDLKLHDIPNTVMHAVSNIASYPMVKGFTIHTSCGFQALQKVAEVKEDKLALGVTILTSVGQDDAWIYGCAWDTSDPGDHGMLAMGGLGHKAVSMAMMAQKAGLNAIVCSPLDLPHITPCGFAKNLLKFTPGIRPKWAAKNDQVRITTPSQAIANGADYLIIGRPITNPPEGMSMRQAVENILEEVSIAISNEVTVAKGESAYSDCCTH